MKIHQNKKRYLTLTVSVALIILFTIAAFLLANHNDTEPVRKKESTTEMDSQKTDYSPPSQQEIDAGKEQKNATVEGGNNSSTLAANFSALNKTSSSIQVRILIEGVTTGTCTLIMQRNDTKVERVASIQPLASSSTCQGFDIPLTDLAPGSWNLTVTIKADTKSKTLTRTVDV